MISVAAISYVELTKAHPIPMAMLQFAILGTLGEIVSQWIVKKSFKYPFTAGMTLWKMLVWATLAIGIKYAFKGFTGFTEHLIHEHYLPELSRLGKAFAISSFMNLQFGLFLVLIHRVLDNIPLKVKNWANLHKGFYSLLWFWIPAHTITFTLPTVYQIGLAAVWSVFLGLILGFFNRK
ncbi:MAG: hypothetical protein V3576_04445 [Candidatus Cloacimonadota bacterium]